DSDSLVEANAAGNLRRRRSCTDGQNVTVTYEFSGDQSNAPFLSTPLALLLVVVGGMAKGLIEQRLDDHGAAMISKQQPSLLEFSEIAADCCRRHFQAFSQRPDGHLPGAQQ